MQKEETWRGLSWFHQQDFRTVYLVLLKFRCAVPGWKRFHFMLLILATALRDYNLLRLNSVLLLSFHNQIILCSN